MPNHPGPPAPEGAPLTRRAALAGLVALTCTPAAAQPPVPPNARDLEAMRLGLLMLGENVERAFERAGISRRPSDLTLGQLRELYAVLSRAVEIGPEEARRIEEIVSR